MVMVNIPTIIEAKNLNIEFIEIVFSNTNTLSKINSILSTYDVKTIYYVVLGNYTHQKAFYVVSLSPLADIREIVRKLSGLKDVKEVNYGTKVIGNFAISPFMVSIVSPLKNIENVLMSRDFLLEALWSLRKKWGLASLVFLYHLGYNYGKELAKALSKDNVPANVSLTLSLEFLRLSGFYKDYEAVTFNANKGNLVLYIYGSVECSKAYERKPSSNFLRGIIGGIVSEIAKKDVTVYEIKCVSKGDNYCEFVS